MGNPLIRIPREELPNMVGKQIHLAWARSKGMVWQLISIDGDTIHLRTPSTWKPLTAKAEDACYTRAHEPVAQEAS